MRSYFIFAIVLTVAYLIYYAVIIMQDLYGKGEPARQRRKFSTSAHLRTKRVLP